MACRVTQLTYHPAFDPYHQIFRTIRLLLQVDTPFDANKLRLADFYLLFPEKIPGIRLSRELRRLARDLDVEPRFPYDRTPEARLIFARMEPTFQAALQTMFHESLVDRELAEQNVLALGPSLPKGHELTERASAANASEAKLMSFLQQLITDFSFFGPDGLKARTALEEYRYDAV
jgi:hypothetical protein